MASSRESLKRTVEEAASGHSQGTRHMKTALTSENHRREFSQVSAMISAPLQVSAVLVQYVNYR
ncbi:hypothetical protein [Streptacidiphilus sp. MAP12-20]|uniref:hypothetical protein n=1 Tax=Streptacidiphilus sp. MAP12-20 TaxID=3156299 RepID=UPI00351519A7